MTKALAHPAFVIGYPVLLAVLQVAFQEWLGDRRRRAGFTPSPPARKRRPVWDQAEPGRPPAEEEVSLRDIACDRARTRREIRRQRKALRRTMPDRDASRPRDRSSGEDAIPVILAVVAALVVAAGYLAARSAIQLALLTLSGLALGSLISVVLRMRRRREIAGDWTAFLFTLCVSFLLGFVCVWQLRDPLFAGEQSRYRVALEAYDDGGFHAVLDEGGRDAVLFFALQGFAVLVAVMAFFLIARMFVGLRAEVSERLGREAHGWRSRVLDDERDSGASPRAAAFGAIAATAVATLLASGAVAAGSKAIEPKPAHFTSLSVTRIRDAIVVQGTIKPVLIGSTQLDVILRLGSRTVRTVRRTVGTKPFTYSIGSDNRGRPLRPGLYRVVLSLDGKQAAMRRVRLPRRR